MEGRDQRKVKQFEPGRRSVAETAEDLSREALRTIAEILPFRRATAVAVHEETGNMRVLATLPEIESESPPPSAPYPTPTGRGRRNATRESGSLVTLPLTTDDRMVGMISIILEEPDAFRDRARAHCLEIAHRLAEALTRLETSVPTLPSRVSESPASYGSLDDRYRAVVDSTGVGVFQADAEGRIVFANARLLDLGGYKPHEVVGRSVHELLSPEYAAWMGEQRVDANTPSTSEILDLEMVRRDGSRIVVLCAPGVLAAEDGIVGFTASIFDASRRRQRLDRLGKRVQALKRTNARLSEINSELEAFAYSISHDLLAPVRSIRATAESLLREAIDPLPSTIREQAERVAETSERIQQRIEDLLAYTRLGRVQHRIVPLDLDEVVDEALAQLHGELEARRAVIDVERPLPRVLGHHSVLVHVLMNLVTNATKFVEPSTRPHVRIRGEVRGPNARLLVVDNGIGIAPHHRERVFRLFERLHGADLYPGSGLGLAIVQRAMHRLGGQVGIDENPAGAGTIFWIELPSA